MDPEIKIALDHEGGKILRLPWNISQKQEYMTQERLGELYLRDPKLAKKETYEKYSLLAKDLKELGIDINFAPVLDIPRGDAHNIIGSRSFGNAIKENINLSKKITAELSLIAVQAMLDNDIIPALKHMPGHGASINDTHEKLSVVGISKKELQSIDYYPFKYVSKKIKNHDNILGMVAHIIYTDIDPNKPATISRKMKQEIRQNIGFKGLIISDAIEMTALCMAALQGKSRVETDFKELTKTIVQSGAVDVVLYCGFQREPNYKDFITTMKNYFEGLN